jgi:hypothetical protein
MCFNEVVANVLRLCEEAELKAQMFGLAQMLIRIPNVQFSTEPAILPNCCWWLVFFIVHLFSCSKFFSVCLR